MEELLLLWMLLDGANALVLEHKTAAKKKNNTAREIIVIGSNRLTIEYERGCR